MIQQEFAWHTGISLVPRLTPLTVKGTLSIELLIEQRYFGSFLLRRNQLQTWRCFSLLQPYPFWFPPSRKPLYNASPVLAVAARPAIPRQKIVTRNVTPWSCGRRVLMKTTRLSWKDAQVTACFGDDHVSTNVTTPRRSLAHRCTICAFTVAPKTNATPVHE